MSNLIPRDVAGEIWLSGEVSLDCPGVHKQLSQLFFPRDNYRYDDDEDMRVGRRRAGTKGKV